MTTPKPSATLFSKDLIAGAKTYPNLSGLRQSHTSGYQTPPPCDPSSTSVLPVAKSTTTRSGCTCATVTISQAAFMQPSTAKERHYSFPFPATYPTVRITSGATAQLYPGGTDGNCLTCSNQCGGGGSTHGFRARRRRYW
jgi:hypothetical protein